MGLSPISWTADSDAMVRGYPRDSLGYTLNVWRGCEKATYTCGGQCVLHAGCLNCYAEEDVSCKLHGVLWGKGQPRVPMAESRWAEVRRWARKAAKDGKRKRVFCMSLGDVLDPAAPAGSPEKLWQLVRDTAVIGATGKPLHGLGVDYSDCLRHGPSWRPGLDYLFLTKRPERWESIPEDIRPLVWLGTSASDQSTWDEYVGRLVQARGFRGLFVSLAPQVEPVDVRGVLARYGPRSGGALKWLIQEGESGRKARPFRIEWARRVRDCCREAGVAYHLKQVGAFPVDVADNWREWRALGKSTSELDADGGDCRVFLDDSHGGSVSEWPEDLRVRESPEGL